MTDRELLELAAKAAGIYCEIGEFYGGRCFGTNEYNEIVFDPLTDDGDALRLAVKLQFNLWIGDGGTDVKHDDRPYLNVREYAMNNDPYAATRRAIVRAAAEIGKEIKK